VTVTDGASSSFESEMRDIESVECCKRKERKTKGNSRKSTHDEDLLDNSIVDDSGVSVATLITEKSRSIEKLSRSSGEGSGVIGQEVNLGVGSS